MNIGTLAAIAAIVGPIVAGAIYVETKKADKVVVADAVQDVRLEAIDYRVNQKTKQIERINTKVTKGTASDEDLRDLEDLKADKEWLREQKNSIQK